MNERSLHLSVEGLKKVNLAMAATNMTPERLAMELKLASLYVNKFFRGESIPTQLFAQICEGLGLGWQELFDLSAPAPASSGIDGTIQEVRQKCHDNLSRRCNCLKIVDMTEPKELKVIYTNHNVIEDSGQLRKKLSLLHDRTSLVGKIGDRLKRTETDFYLGRLANTSAPALNTVKQYQKLLIWGGIGTGKTTFFKYLALQCLSGNFHGELAPVLIYLEDFAQGIINLTDHIIQTFYSYGFKDTNVIEQLLSQGKLLILLDGLDCVPEASLAKTISEIKSFSDQFYRNHIFINSRHNHYNFEQFSNLEIAKFNDDQIQIFVKQWFNNKDIAHNFLRAIVSQLAIKELCTNPLLLTYMCLVFDITGDSDGNFNYLDMVEQCLDLYVKQAQKLLSKSHPPRLWLKSLTKAALCSLAEGKQIFKSKHLENWLTANDLAQALQLGIISQPYKDIFTFTFKAFQEYLASLKIVNSTNPHALPYLGDRLEEPEWQSPILLTAAMLIDADELILLLYKKANQILEKHQNLQNFLDWINKNSNYLRVSYQPATLRAFYLDIDLNNFRTQDRQRAIEITHSRTLMKLKERSEEDSGFSETAISNDYDLAIALNKFLAEHISKSPTLELAGLLEPQLRRSLQVLKEQIPEPDKFDSWWTGSGIGWAKDCRNLLIQHRKGTQDWTFTPAEITLLRRYHDAHIIFIKCLNGSAVSPDLRQSLLESMFLPIWQQPAHIFN